MSLRNTLKFITSHPLNKKRKTKALIRFISWQISTIINPYPILYSFAEKSKLIIRKGLHGATGNLYCGLDEFEDMAFVLHFLRKDDLFIDIGANIGSYSILAGSEVGAETISIEPIPQTFEILKSNIALNNIFTTTRLLNIGLGSHREVIKFTKSLDTVNHVATIEEKDTIDVQIEKFDDIIDINKITLIKIDVEGFEAEVLNGMSNVLRNPLLKAIIIELNGSGNRYGFDEDKIHRKLMSFEFEPYFYSPFERKILKTNSSCSNNTIYIKDIELIKERISSAKKIKIFEEIF